MLTIKQIKTKTAAIARAGAKLRDQIQEVAVSCIGHAFEHGDVTLATNLLDACGKVVEREALVRYFEDHGPFKWSKHDVAFGLNKSFRKDNVFDEEYLNNDAAKWYDYSRPLNTINSKFDFDGKVVSLLKQLDKAEKDGKVVEGVDAEYLDDIRNAAIKFHLRAA